MADVTTFTTFLQETVGIPVTALPPTSPIISTAFTYAQAIVPCFLIQVAGQPIYDLAVYYAGASFVLNWAPDQPEMSWFADYRKDNGLASSNIGVVVGSASDQGSSVTFVVPDWVKNASMADLQWLKDPYGRALLGILQQLGTLWGLT